MRRESLTMFAQSPPTLVPTTPAKTHTADRSESPTSSEDERRPLHNSEVDGDRRRYGSIVGSPPTSDSPGYLPSLELPDPALNPHRSRPPPSRIGSARATGTLQSVEDSPDAYHVGPQHKPKKSRKVSDISKKLFQKHNTLPAKQQSKLKRVFASRPLDSPALPDVQLEAYKELDAKQDEFFNFLDRELEKIEKFYKSKEEEANDRLQVLRDQLHELRDRRLEDMKIAKRGGKIADDGIIDGQFSFMSAPKDDKNEHYHANGQKILEAGKGLVRQRGKIGKTSEAMEQLSSPKGPTGKQPANGSNGGNGGNADYVKKAVDHDRVPYRFAKRRLKLALQEFYRGLELLKSYALLNRTAFRKVNKKYDKAVNARPTLQYMSSKVNNAHFVQSTLVEGHLVTVEDLYARYFERGNHKVAVNKLRSKLRPGDQSATTFRNGLYVAAGVCFGITGLINASEYLFSSNAEVKLRTSYLLQIYAGYFLALLLFLMFVLDCRIWHRARVNYIFIFEYDTRHVLDWRQLAELPCFFLLLNGLFLWLNFRFPASSALFLYWPVILIGISAVITFLPLKILYHQSRYWFAYSNWRLLLAGLYPVEFRDFFFGDMYCSETYTLSQLSLFFCLYARNWNDPPQCNSGHSMLLGFFTTLPAIWRALQCLRRYYDTRNWFPHLANFAKYFCNILYYMTLSLYRLQHSNERHAVFIVFAILNGVYCSVWDVLMDWSLGNPYARYPFLRDNLAFRRAWIYYVAIIVDVVLRQQWILYAIYTHDLQHSSIVSFIVALAEVIRRGMWSVFRVENEHCNNVVQFRASRDVPLPYALRSSDSTSTKDKKRNKKSKNKTDEDTSDDETTVTSPNPTTPSAGGSGTATAIDLERQKTNTSSRTGDGSMRQRKNQTTPGLAALRRVGTVIAAAHSQDFQKKKVDIENVASNISKKEQQESSDEDDDDTDDGHHHSPQVSDVDENGKPLTSPTKKSRHKHSKSNSQSHGASGSSVRFKDNPTADPASSESEPDLDSKEPGLGRPKPRSIESDPESPKAGKEEEEEAAAGSSPVLNVEAASDTESGTLDDAELTEVRETIQRARSPG